jgi:predicted negative regulator of RcsB-dependent stress response
MTNPSSGTDAATTVGQPKAESFLDWFHINSRWVGVGAVAVLAAAAIAWYVPKSKAMKNENADRALLTAKQALDPRNPNPALAEVDLRRVADRYAGTPSGDEAALLLASSLLDRGDAEGAATYLKQAAGKIANGSNAAAARGLLGDAYAQLNRYADAAAEYEAAAGLTTMLNERALLLTKAGHAYSAAGKVPEARRIWEGLAGQTENPGLAAEARVRLGELAVARG